MMQVDSMTSSLMDMVVSGNSDINNQQMETDTLHQQQQQQVMLQRQQEELLRQQEYQQQLMKMQNIRYRNIIKIFVVTIYLFLDPCTQHVSRVIKSVYCGISIWNSVFLMYLVLSSCNYFIPFEFFKADN